MSRRAAAKANSPAARSAQGRPVSDTGDKRAAGSGWLVLALAWLAATAWIRPLMLPDEGRYVGVAWEMLRSGDWLTPTLNGMPYFHKPPLFYWITAGALSVAGRIEWAARLAPWVGSAAMTVSMFVFARRWAGERAALRILLVLVTLPLAYVAAQFANLDMLVAGCISATVLCLAHAALVPAGPSQRLALWGGYAGAALGMLAKGLIGFVLPGMTIVLWLLVCGRPRRILSLISLPGLLLFVAIGAPWFVLMEQRFPGFVHYFFVIQHFSRFTQSGFNNPQPFWFYPVVLALMALPWTLWLLRRPAPSPARPEAGTALDRLMWVWLAVVVGFFSLPTSKLVGYVLPALPPLAWLIARCLPEALSTTTRRLVAASAVLGTGAALATVLIATFGPHRSTRPLGQAIAAQSPVDAVLMIEGYDFDLGFYAGLRHPVWVADNWDDPAIRHQDSWRKELLDATEFAPAARERLLPLAGLAAGGCPGASAWVVAPTNAAARYPQLLAGATVVASTRERILLRVSGWSPPGRCPGTPSETPAGRS